MVLFERSGSHEFTDPLLQRDRCVATEVICRINNCPSPAKLDKINSWSPSPETTWQPWSFPKTPGSHGTASPQLGKSRFRDGGGTLRPLTMIYSCSATPSAAPMLCHAWGAEESPSQAWGITARRPGLPQPATLVLTSIWRRRRRKHETGERIRWARLSHPHPCLGWLHGEKLFSSAHVLL